MTHRHSIMEAARIPVAMSVYIHNALIFQNR